MTPTVFISCRQLDKQKLHHECKQFSQALSSLVVDFAYLPYLPVSIWTAGHPFWQQTITLYYIATENWLHTVLSSVSVERGTSFRTANNPVQVRAPPNCSFRLGCSVTQTRTPGPPTEGITYYTHYDPIDKSQVSPPPDVKQLGKLTFNICGALLCHCNQPSPTAISPGGVWTTLLLEAVGRWRSSGAVCCRGRRQGTQTGRDCVVLVTELQWWLFPLLCCWCGSYAVLLYRFQWRVPMAVFKGHAHSH